MKTGNSYYFAADFHPSIPDGFYKVGILPFMQGMVPLAKTKEDAIALFLSLIESMGDPLPRTIYVFRIDVPAITALKKIGFRENEGRIYYGYKGTVPPEYIKRKMVVDLDPIGESDKKTDFLQARPYYYPAREADIDEIQKNGIQEKEITLTETAEEAALFGSTKFETKANGIKTIALVTVNIPISATLKEAAVDTLTGDKINTFTLSQPIPPEWIGEIGFIDFKEGGLFA